MAVTQETLEEVDEFLQGAKWLEDDIPDWKHGVRPGQWDAVWNIEEKHGVSRAHMRFRISSQTPGYPSVSVIFRMNPVWRVDLKPEKDCEPNPPWAAGLGLPAEVCGNHSHEWVDNREHIRQSKEWDLPCRRPVEPQMRRVPQMLFWLADRIGIELTSDQRNFDAPPRADLFEF